MLFARCDESKQINSLLLRASINGILHEDSGYSPILYKPIEIIRIFPPLGDVRGGTIVSVLIKAERIPIISKCSL